MPLTDVATVKAHLGITGSADDTLITRFINEGTAMLTAYTGRQWEQTGPETRYFHAVENVVNRGRDLLVDWIDDISDVDNATNGDGENVLAYCILVRHVRLRLKANSGKYWNWISKDDPTDAIAVGGGWGPATTDVRAVEFVIDYAVWKYRTREAGNVSAALVTQVGGASILQPVGMPDELREKLFALIPPRL